MPMECSFQRDTCQWSAVKNETKANVDWVLASVSRRPANLMDHTFAAPRNQSIRSDLNCLKWLHRCLGGYVYFDVFNQGNDPEVIRMVGPKIPPATQSCFTFWFAAFGPDGSTQLRVLIANPDFGTETGPLQSIDLCFGFTDCLFRLFVSRNLVSSGQPVWIFTLRMELRSSWNWWNWFGSIGGCLRRPRF